MRRGGMKCGLFRPVRCDLTPKLVLVVVDLNLSVFVNTYMLTTGINIVYNKVNTNRKSHLQIQFTHLLFY